VEFINLEGHASEQRRLRSLLVGVAPCAALLVAFSTAAWADDGGNAVRWTANGAPTEAMIKGGPWTLEQSGAAVGLKSAGYCDASGKLQIGNPGTERMQPYYFPSILGHGRHLQGYFDWRPKDIDEAVVAAESNDAGYTWTFQQKVLELRKDCPTMANKEPDGEIDSVSGNNADNGDDDGQGHPYIIKINGHNYLYTLVRANGHIDKDDLAIHELTPLHGQPLNGAPTMSDAATDNSPAGAPETPFHTNGLVNPDGILAAIPGTSPLSVIYERKFLKGDIKYAAAQQCSSNGLDGWGPYYGQNGGLSTNHDITELWLATTTDGITFNNIGRLKGLNDPYTVAANGTRWVATAGTVLQLPGGRYGLFFSGGGCIDADSDAFHYIGYAESNDLLNWTVVNGFDNPIMSVAPVSLTVNASGVPNNGFTPITIPAQPPVVADTHGWFAGRVYGPSATKFTSHDVTLVFAGYHTPKPKNGLGDYRTIGRVSLHSSRPLLIVGNNPEDGGWIGDNQ